MSSLAKKSGLWQWAMFSFVLAGLTGFLFRLGFVVHLPIELNFENLRHAHSHLMFFGWASLLPLYFIKLDAVPGYHAALGARLMKNALWGILFFSLLSFPPFLFYGYKSVPFGNSLLPLSVIFSGMVMIGWYAFMAGYLLTRFRKHGFRPNVWFEGAMVVLFISSLGAWAVGAMQFLNIGGPLMSKALTHFFLATFVEGWVVLILLGLIAKAFKLKEEDFVVSPLILVGLIAIGAPLTFPYGISDSLISFDLSVAARMGGFLIAEGVLLFVYSVIKGHKGKLSIWLWPLLFLIVKSVMQLTASVAPIELWLSDHGIRILYLHVILLGAFTTGVICYIQSGVAISNRYYYFILGSVIFLIATLLLMTHFWPISLSGIWVYDALMVGAAFPAIAILIYWLKLRKALEI